MTNNKDKRSVTTDALETLATIIGENEGRDAIHLAVENAIAAHTLRPGEDVGFVDGGVGICDDPVGIVDPFLKNAVNKGEHFWLVVYPRQITSLRHVWTHPKFDDKGSVTVKKPDASDEAKRAESEAWLRDFLKNNGPSYEDLINAVDNGGQYYRDSDDDYYSVRIDGEYLHAGGTDAHGSIPPQFWDHVEIVTGKKMHTRPEYFSCSC